MSIIKFNMAARCEAAGRPNNEDNFQLTDNLSGDQWSFITGKEVDLDEKGALMVVCDGMGGMNAGEVASGLAVKTIKDLFSADKLTPQVMESAHTIKQYVEQAIIAADNKIRDEGSQNGQFEGMGSTVVLAWFVGKEVFIGWCGDSRAYRFNPSSGLERLSHDHSYVQDLVDSGKLSEELAFDHPDNNIITRSLGDSHQQARPEVKCFPLCNNDVILLCSDGLSGVLRDEEISAIMAGNYDKIDRLRNALWIESEKAGWTDNVTIALCRITSGAGAADPSEAEFIRINTDSSLLQKRKRMILWIVLIVLLLIIAVAIGFYFLNGYWWSPMDLFNSGNTAISKLIVD